MVCLWLGKTRAVDLGEVEHINIHFLAFDSEKQNICMRPVWIQNRVRHPSLPCSWAMTCHKFIIDHRFRLPAAELPRLSIDIHTGLQVSFYVRFTRKLGLSLISRQCVLLRLYCKTHRGHLTGSFASLIFRPQKVALDNPITLFEKAVVCIVNFLFQYLWFLFQYRHREYDINSI